MNKQFMGLCGSGGNCAIDDSMIKCKSRLPYIIYQPQKPVCDDIQVFVRSNSPMGYMQQFQIYVGSKITKTSSNRLYFDVVNSLTKPLCGTYARVYFDNAYTSIPILHHLQKHKILACGTIRALRKYLPPEIKKPEKMIRGQHKTFQDVDNVFMTTTVWQDTKPVCFAFNFHKPHVNSTTMHQVGRQYVQVSIPHISKEYQKHYKAIHFFDQLAERYTVGRRCYRSWLYIFNWILNAAVVNSYILQGLALNVARKKKYAQIDFRHELALGPINNYTSRQIRPQCKPLYIGPGAPVAAVNHVNTHEC